MVGGEGAHPGREPGRSERESGKRRGSGSPGVRVRGVVFGEISFRLEEPHAMHLSARQARRDLVPERDIRHGDRIACWRDGSICSPPGCTDGPGCLGAPSRRAAVPGVRSIHEGQQAVKSAVARMAAAGFVVSDDVIACYSSSLFCFCCSGSVGLLSTLPVDSFTSSWSSPSSCSSSILSAAEGCDRRPPALEWGDTAGLNTFDRRQRVRGTRRVPPPDAAPRVRITAAVLTAAVKFGSTEW